VQVDTKGTTTVLRKTWVLSIEKREKCGKKGDATKNVEEENSTLGMDDTNQRKILGLVMWYLSPIDPLRHLFSNPRELMRFWASDERKKGDGVLHHHPMHNSGRALM